MTGGGEQRAMSKEQIYLYIVSSLTPTFNCSLAADSGIARRSATFTKIKRWL